MLGRRTDDTTISRRKAPFKRFVRAVVWLVLAALVITVAAKARIVPEIIRRRVERGLSKFCEGPVEIKHVETGRSGQVTLEGIQFCDELRRPWLVAEKASAVLANWPSLSPTVEEIAVDGLSLRLSIAEGKFTFPPVRFPQRSTRAGGRPGIRKLAINRGAIMVVDPEGVQTVYGDLTLSVIRITNGEYEFSLNRITGESSELLLATGGVNVHSADFDVLLQMKHRFTKAEMALPFVAFGRREMSAEGNVYADLAMTGSLKKPGRWRPNGTVRLRDWVVEADGATAWNPLNADVKVSPAGFGFENVSVCDSNGIEWFSGADAELALADWPGRKPVLTQIELTMPRLRTVAADGGGFKIPAWLPKGRAEDPKAGLSSLQRLVVRDATVAVEDANNPEIVFDRLWLDATRKGQDSYDIAASHRAPDDSNAVAVKGLVNLASSQVKLSVKTDHVAGRQETAMLFAALGKAQYAVEGKLVADLTIAGRLNTPLQLEAEGSATLDGCTLFFKEGTLAETLNATAGFDGRRLDIEQFSAALCNGRVSGYFHADVSDENQMEFRGRVLAVNVNFPEFVSVLTPKAQKATGGTFTASYDFNGQRNGTRTFNGEGLVFFDDADVRVLPAIPQIFESAGLSQYEPLRMSDAEAIFTTTGSIVTIQSGHISNRFAAIEFEPGGTIDLKARQIDGYVVAAPLSQIAGAVEQLPVVRVFARVKDKLIRLHVKGDWADPPGKLVKKEPIKDLKESTVGFIRDVVKGSGQFGRGMLDRLGG
ncbi:MAG: AsmA family protein, partial [Planctomycetota bacterium]